MAAITDIRLTDALVQVGPDLVTLDGFGDDKFSFGPSGDVGAMVDGVDGDVMFIGRARRGWLMDLTFFNASPGIDVLLALAALQAPFALNVKYGNFTFVGFGKMLNVGQVTASLGTTTRTMQMGAAYVSGNINAAPGTVLQIL
jgi:hypothetical protein